MEKKNQHTFVGTHNKRLFHKNMALGGCLLLLAMIFYGIALLRIKLN